MLTVAGIIPFHPRVAAAILILALDLNVFTGPRHQIFYLSAFSEHRLADIPGVCPQSIAYPSPRTKPAPHLVG